MRIAIIQGAFLPVPPRRGGAVEKRWFRIAQEFAAAGHEVTHISRRCDDLPEAEVIAGVQHRRVPGYDTPSSGLRLKLLDLLYSRRAVRHAKAADIVVTNTFWSPLLLRRHPGLYVDVARMPKGQMRLYRHAARLRANSEAVRDAILREDPGAASRVRVIPNPLPFSPPATTDWSKKQHRVLFVGRLHPEKGVELLLQAFTHAQTRGALTGWTLELVGPADAARGGGGDDWAAALRTRYASPHIHWHGPVFDTAALNAHYQAATVFAYPSLAEAGETFGLAPLEAMAWGALPVVSDLACFRDFIHRDRNGLVFDHRSATAAEALATTLAQATSDGARPLAEAALDVRRTHAPAVIADTFLRDFATLVRPTTRP